LEGKDLFWSRVLVDFFGGFVSAVGMIKISYASSTSTRKRRCLFGNNATSRTSVIGRAVPRKEREASHHQPHAAPT